MYKYNRNFFESINTESQAYWAGFIAADGNVRKDFLKMRIELNIKDKNHLFKLREDIQGDMPIKESVRTNNHSCYIDLNSIDICKDLNKLGITPNKSLSLDINFNLIPVSLISHFIRGYFDGDGSLCHTVMDGKIRWQVNFIGTEKFLKDIMFYIQKEHCISTCGSNYRFNFSKFEDVKDITDFMYKNATIYLDRKYEKYLEFSALNDYQAVSY